MKLRTAWHRILCVSFFVVAGCGSSSQQGGGDGGPPAGDTLGTLNGAQIGALCDQLAAMEGGYSHVKMLSCDGAAETVSFQIGANQTQCKQLLQTIAASCASLTVGAVQACVSDSYAVTCASPSPIAPSCDPFFACAVGDASSQ